MILRKTLKTLAVTTAATVLALAGLVGPTMAETLKFISWQKDEKGVGDWWASVIAEFEKQHPGVTIEWTKVERAAYADTMTTLFAGGSPPDIIHLASFEYQGFADNGWLENLDPWIAKGGIDLTGWAGQPACTWDGQTVCLTMLYYGGVFAYNEELLASQGLAVPTNWAEFLDAAQKLTVDLNGDNIIDQYGTGHETKGGAGQYLAEMSSYLQDAGANYTDDNGQVTIDTPETIEGLTRWKTIVQDQLTPRDLSAGEVRQLFADGKIAMKVDGPWLYAIMQAGAASEHLKFAPTPFHPPLGGVSNVLSMSSEISEEHKQLVWDFMTIAASDEFQSSFATLAASTPPSPRADVTEATKEIPHFGLLVDAQQEAAAANINRPPKGLEIQYNEFSKMIMEETQRMIIEDLEPADVVKTMQEKAVALQ